MVNFNAAPNKKAKLVLETTAFKQSRSDLNVAFSTADRETGIFEFTVTQDNKPLLLGQDNIKSSIVFIHSNGLKMKAPMVITDGLNGRISYQVPDDILATPGKVTAQVYVARKSKKETYAVVAERIFSFEIEKSLAWEFDAETKLNYIVEFDELEAQLKQRLIAIEDAMSNLEDYVARVEQARDKGLSDIEIAKTNSLDELDTLASNKLNEINTKGTQYVEELTDVRNGIDEKINQFNDDVKADNYVKEESTENWQKYKFTQDDGSIKYFTKGTIKDIKTLPPGLYETVSDDDATNQGIPVNNTYVQIKVWGTGGGRKEIELTSTFYGKKYFRLFHTDGEKDTGWREIAAVSGGNSIETEYGAQNKADTAYSDAIEYFNDKMDANFKSLWKGNASEKGTVINLEEKYTDYKMIFIVYYSVGGTKNASRFTNGLGRIYIQDFNLDDDNGSLARFFETALDVENDKQFRIRHNHTYLPESNTGISNSNAIEYREIVGVK